MPCAFLRCGATSVNLLLPAEALPDWLDVWPEPFFDGCCAALLDGFCAGLFSVFDFMGNLSLRVPKVWILRSSKGERLFYFICQGRTTLRCSTLALACAGKRSPRSPMRNGCRHWARHRTLPAGALA